MVPGNHGGRSDGPAGRGGGSLVVSMLTVNSDNRGGHGCGGGLVVNMLSVNYDNLGSIPAVVQ